MEGAALRRLARRQANVEKAQGSGRRRRPSRFMRSTLRKSKWSGPTRNMRWSFRARSWLAN
jgi:hypothetical protein